MKNKISKKKLERMIDSGFTDLSSDAIKTLIDEELLNDESLIDTDYVDMCFTLLEIRTREKPVMKKYIKKARALLIAATFVVIFSIAIPVGAKFVSKQADDNMVKYVDDNFVQDLADGKTDAFTHSDESNLTVKAIKEGGISEVIVPSAILNDFNATDIQFDNPNGMTTANVKIESKTSESYGYIDITQYNISNYEFIKGQSIMGTQYDTVKQITVNGMDVLIFSCDDNCSISYIDNHIEYFILLENCTQKEAIEIMKTLK